MRVTLHVMDAQSLKQKRAIVRGLRDRLLSRFDCAASEVGSQDLWQRAELGMAIVSLESKDADAKLRNIEEYIRTQPGAIVTAVEREIIPM